MKIFILCLIILSLLFPIFVPYRSVIPLMGVQTSILREIYSTMISGPCNNFAHFNSIMMMMMMIAISQIQIFSRPTDGMWEISSWSIWLVFLLQLDASLENFFISPFYGSCLISSTNRPLHSLFWIICSPFWFICEHFFQ